MNRRGQGGVRSGVEIKFSIIHWSRKGEYDGRDN
jgi:hypothetical protein